MEFRSFSLYLGLLWMFLPSCLGCHQKVTNEGIVIDCRSRGLSDVPEDLPTQTVALDLSQNKILKLSNIGVYTEMKFLNLSHNSLAEIVSGAFDSNKNLESLDLTFNRLRFDDYDFSNRLFKYNQKLSKLLLAGQYVKSESLDKVVDAILELPNLEQLSLSPINNDLPHKLASLPKLRVLNFQWGDIQILNKNVLGRYANTSLEQLSFHQCNVKSIENGTFDNFENLRLLNVACNHDLDPSNVITALSASSNYSINSLVMDGLLKKEGGVWPLGYDDRYECQKVWSKIEKISVRGINFLNVFTNVTRCLKNLTSLAWGFAKVLDTRIQNEIEYLHNWNIMNMSQLAHVSMPYIGHSGVFFGRQRLLCRFEDGISPPENEAYFVDQPLECVKQGPGTTENRSNNSQCIRIPSFIGQCVKYLDLSHFLKFPLYDVRCVHFSPNQVEFLNMSHWDFGNPVTGTFLKHLNFPVFGLHDLKILDLSYSGVETITTSFLLNMTSLTHLYLKGNGLHPLTIEPFPKLKQLTTLNMNKNRLADLNQSTLSNLDSLTNLYIQKNDLRTLEFLPEVMRSLRHLDVSHNKITTLTETATSLLEQLNQHSGGLVLYLEQNPLDCSCHHLHFIEWSQTTKIKLHNYQNLTCTHEEKTILLHKVDLSHMARKCTNLYLIISLSTVLPLIIIIMGTICYKKRWTIKWHYHVFKRYCRHLSGNRPYLEDTYNEPFHAVVIFPLEGDTSRAWVFNDLRPKVESEWNLKLHLLGRNDNPGKFKIDDVVDGVKASRKAIWLITPEFFKDNICIHAVHFAICHLRADSNVIVTLDNAAMNDDLIPKSMKNLLNPKMKIKKIKYTHDEVGNRLFWDKLRRFLLGESIRETKN